MCLLASAGSNHPRSEVESRMALIACHECGAQISSDAIKCPQCGATNKTVANMQTIWLVVIVVCFFVLLIASLVTSD